MAPAQGPAPNFRPSRSATHAATLASGRHCDDDDCFVFELREGRIARVREYMDTQKGRTAIFS